MAQEPENRWRNFGLEGHARRIYAMVEVATVSAARTLSRRLLDRKLPVIGFTARDVVRMGWTGLKTTWQAEGALGALEEYGWVVGDATADHGGRPTTKYYINPLIYCRAP